MKHNYIESLKDKSDLTLKSYDDFKENSKKMESQLRQADAVESLKALLKR
ncbi:hypothetical protein AGMMS49592_6170 [Endomicrobiia bacterium]|nr:hypothetical protein AGMMS49592_6170 [Endomicrobiia bacterium]